MAARGYLEIPDPLNLGHWVVDRHVAEGRGGRVAVRAGGATYTFDDLRRLSNRAGHAFRALGVARGDRVLAPYKTPHEVEFVTELPKMLTGKVLRRRLREHAGPAGRERER